MTIKIASFVIKGLKQSGFSVDHAGDGEAALGCCRDVSYDAIILDIMLPKTGLRTLDQGLGKSHQCRSDPETSP